MKTNSFLWNIYYVLLWTLIKQRNNLLVIKQKLSKEIITKVRGNHVTTQNPEVNYEALEKYGRDLVEEVRQGKMDPVIGRDEEIRNTIRILSRKTKTILY